jgi:hypothetical protein
MTKKKPSTLKRAKPSTLQAEAEKPIALTVKIDSRTYVRLSAPEG